MNGPALSQHATNHRPTGGLNGIAHHALGDFGRKAVVGHVMIKSVITCNPNCGSIGATKPRRRLNKRVEHSLQVEGRATDHLEHVGGSGLLRERFTEVVGALAQLVEQPRVLDRDNRLRGKVLHQLDLPVGERTHFLAVDSEHSDQLVTLEHRHVKKGAGPRETNDGAGVGTSFREHVHDVNDLLSL